MPPCTLPAARVTPLQAIYDAPPPGVEVPARTRNWLIPPGDVDLACLGASCEKHDAGMRAPGG